MARHWLLRVDYAGRSYLWSDAPVTPVDSDGRPWPHLGGLPEVRVPSDYDPFQQQPRVQTVSVEVEWPADDPIGVLIQAGHQFARSTAEVSIWSDGDAYEDRKILVSGTPSTPEYGQPGQPVAFSIEGRPWVDTGSTHLDTQRVTNDTWPNGTTTGEPWYPIVIGRPGWGVSALGSVSYASGTPARVVEVSGVTVGRLLIAAHPVHAPTVTISDGSSTESFDVEHVADGVGQVVATVDISGAATISKTETSYTVIWDAGGGMTGPDGYMRGGGDVLLWALNRMQLPVDYGRAYTLRAWLNRFTLAGYIDEPAAPWDLIQDAWLDNLLPVSAVIRAGDLRFIPWRYDATHADAVRSIEVAPGVTMPERIVHERDDIKSRYQLSCAPRANGQSRVSVGLAPQPSDDRRTTASRIVCVASTEVGEVVDTAENAWIGDLATAYLSMHWRSVRGFASRYVEIQDVTGEYTDLEDGDIVTVTHTEAGITSALGLVAVGDFSPVAQSLRVILLPTP